MLLLMGWTTVVWIFSILVSKSEKEEKSRLCVWIGFVPCSLQSSLLCRVEAAHEAIHVIERKGMSYGPQGLTTTTNNCSYLCNCRGR